MIPIYAGLTSQSIDIFIPDSASAVGAGKTGLAYNTASLTAYYRKGAAGSPTPISPLASLANAQAAWSSGGFVEIDATNQPGMYRLDLPNVAVDTAGLVHLMLKGAAGMAPVPVRIDCRALPADMKQIGGDTQSATDIKDFADTGYDPATHKVQGVVLTDTLSTYTGNTPQTGDSFARLGAPAGASIAADIATRASAAQISALQVNTRTNLQVPIEIETPDVGTQVWKIRLHLYDIEGNMEAPDGTPTVTLTNAAGTDRSSRLSAASNPSTGVYTWDYTSTAADAEEQLIWLFTVIEGALTRTYPATSYVVEETAYRFSSTDRATLNATATATGLTAATAAIQGSQATNAQTGATNALTAYGVPTNAQMEARTLVAANYATSSALTTVDLWTKRNAVLLSGLLTGSGTNTEQYTISALGITATCVTDASGNRTSVTWS